MARFYQSRNIGAPGGQGSALDIAQPESAQPDIAQPDTARPEPRPRQVYRAKSAHLPELLEPCLRCGFDFLMPSKPRGTHEEFLDVMGIQYYRCHKCEARYAKVGGRTLGGKPRKERTHVWALLAISGGLLCCTALALYLQKLAHRWPF